jgi:threonine dehydrogenase-like Zn-dependent dehydrogenase
MKAVVFKGPGKVVIEDRPIPKIQDAGDIIVKVEKTALCGRYLESPSMLPTSLTEHIK